MAQLISHNSIVAHSLVLVPDPQHGVASNTQAFSSQSLSLVVG